MTKVKLNSGNETKSDIFPWHIFKSDVIFFHGTYSNLTPYFFIKTIKLFQ